MKRVKCIYAVLLSFMLIMLVGCNYRDVLDDYPVNGVLIKLNWTGVVEKLPDGVQVIFYPKDNVGRKVEEFLPPEGGEISVPPGQYALVIYNYDTEFVAVRGTESYETFEAYTNYCKGLSTSVKMVWSPDPFYVVALDDIKVEKSDLVQPMEFRPVQMTKHLSFEVKVEGLQYISDILCNVDGMDGNYFIGKHCCESSIAPIYVETTKGDGVIKGSFSVFRIPQSAVTRANSVVTMTLKLKKVDNTVQEIKVDITQAVKAPPTPSEPGEEPAPDVDVTIKVPVVDDVIVVEKPEGAGDGGISGGVDDWGDETEVELK